MENEQYGRLEQIIAENLQQKESLNEINFREFVQQMEVEFTRLGFRETPANGRTENILISRFDAVGDFILTVPAIRAVRENFPKANITLAVSERIYPMAELCPYVNEVLKFDTNSGRGNFFEIVAQVVAFVKKNLWKKHYALAIDFLPDFRHLLTAFISGARERVSYYYAIGNNLSLGHLLSNRAVFIDHKKAVHWCERNLNLLRSVGLKVTRTNTEVWFTEKDLKRAKKFLDGFAPNRLKVAVGIGATVPERHYPVEKYLAALKEIIDKGAAIVIFGGPDERDDAKFLEDNLPKEFVKNIVALNPTWRITSAVISLVDMYIGNDTGTHHIAAAFKKPVIVLSRDSQDLARASKNNCDCFNFAAWQTKSITLIPKHPLDDCAENLQSTCWAGKPHCITQIEPADIVAAYDEMLQTLNPQKNLEGNALMKNPYGQLTQIVDDSVQQAVAEKGFKLMEFIKRMEDEFRRLGFRDKSARGSVDNILLLRADEVGDFVLTSAAIREVRMNYPYAHITLVVSKSTYQLAEHCPYVNEVLVFEKPTTERFIDELKSVVKFAAENLWKRRYKLAFSFRYWLDKPTWLLLYLSGAVERVGISGLANRIYFEEEPLKKPTIYSFVYTQAVVPPKEIIHDVARCLYVLQSFGLKVQRTDIEVWFDDNDFNSAKQILNGFAPNCMRIAVGIGAGKPRRKYPVEKYLVALKEIISKGVAVLIFGGPDEVDDAKFLEDNLPKEFVKNIVALNTNWRVTAALLSQTNLYIGNDTGVQHISAALKNPTIVVSPESQKIESAFEHGFSQVAQYYPWQTLTIVLRPAQQLGDCAKATHYGGCKEDKPHCITQIEPSQIVNAFNQIVHFVQFSGIRKVSCPPILKNIDQLTPLQYGFDFTKV